MILCDTSIIVALIRISDDDHEAVTRFMNTVHELLLTTWPCITEAMYLVGQQVGQETIQKQIETGFLSLYRPTQVDALRVCVLMRHYADLPMDFADASLVVAAEVMNITRILTLDGHFYAYRIHDRTPFLVLP